MDGEIAKIPHRLLQQKREFTKGNKTPFSIDVCIINVTQDGRVNRLIHEKTGFTYMDRYYWNEARESKKYGSENILLKTINIGKR